MRSTSIFLLTVIFLGTSCGLLKSPSLSEPKKPVAQDDAIKGSKNNDDRAPTPKAPPIKTDETLDEDALKKEKEEAQANERRRQEGEKQRAEQERRQREADEREKAKAEAKIAKQTKWEAERSARMAKNEKDANDTLEKELKLPKEIRTEIAPLVADFYNLVDEKKIKSKLAKGQLLEEIKNKSHLGKDEIIKAIDKFAATQTKLFDKEMRNTANERVAQFQVQNLEQLKEQRKEEAIENILQKTGILLGNKFVPVAGKTISESDARKAAKDIGQIVNDFYNKTIVPPILKEPVDEELIKLLGNPQSIEDINKVVSGIYSDVKRFEPYRQRAIAFDQKYEDLLQNYAKEREAKGLRAGYAPMEFTPLAQNPKTLKEENLTLSFEQPFRKWPEIYSSYEDLKFADQTGLLLLRPIEEAERTGNYPVLLKAKSYLYTLGQNTPKFAYFSFNIGANLLNNYYRIKNGNYELWEISSGLLFAIPKYDPKKPQGEGSVLSLGAKNPSEILGQERVIIDEIYDGIKGWSQDTLPKQKQTLSLADIEAILNEGKSDVLKAVISDRHNRARFEDYALSLTQWNDDAEQRTHNLEELASLRQMDFEIPLDRKNEFAENYNHYAQRDNTQANNLLSIVLGDTDKNYSGTIINAIAGSNAPKKTMLTQLLRSSGIIQQMVKNHRARIAAKKGKQ